MHSINYLFIFALFSSCTIYKSPDRKNFESSATTFTAQNLKPVSCSNESIATNNNNSRLVTTLQNNSDQSVFLWEHQFKNNSVFESNNLNGVYCIYEKN